MSTTQHLLSEFIDAWNAGHRPRVRDYLARAEDEEQREELADQLTVWLEVASTPRYDAGARAAIRNHPIVQHALAGPSALAVLRERRGVSVRQLAERVVARFELAREDTDRAARYLDQIERGELDPARLSRRLLEALADFLGASPGTLLDLGGRPGAPAGALMRAQERPDAQFLDDLERLSQAAMRPAEQRLDPLDRLFLGGPQG